MAIGTLNPNRVSTAIEAVRAHFATLDADKLAAVDATLAVDFEEHFAYQELQARSHASGTLSTDEARIIYAALGEVGSPSNGGWSTGVDVATKYTVTRVIQMLLERKLGPAS